MCACAVILTRGLRDTLYSTSDFWTRSTLVTSVQHCWLRTFVLAQEPSACMACLMRRGDHRDTTALIGVSHMLWESALKNSRQTRFRLLRALRIADLCSVASLASLCIVVVYCCVHRCASNSIDLLSDGPPWRRPSCRRGNFGSRRGVRSMVCEQYGAACKQSKRLHRKH